jgi:hypothetical protein
MTDEALDGDLELECPPCKLLANSGGLNGALRGLLAVREDLLRRGKDWAPELYEALNQIVCGAHQEIVALEPKLIRGPFVDL